MIGYLFVRNKMKPRVGFVLSGVPGYSEIFIINTIRVMQAKNIEVILFTDKPGKVAFVQHVAGFNLSQNLFFRLIKVTFVLCLTLLRAPVRMFRYVFMLKSENRGLSEIVRSIFMSAHILPYRLTHLHFGFATLAVHREFLGKVMGAKLSVSIRGYDVCIYPLLNRYAYNRLWPNLDRVHTISDDLHRVIIKLGLPSEVPVIKINPAIETQFFREPDGANATNGNRLRIITVARLHWKKGIEYALEALLILKNKGIDFTYTLIGEGEEREKLVFLVHQMGMNDCVEFTGRLTHKVVIEKLSTGQVYLQPSIQEGFCNAVLEAQASGLLCIVSDAEGLQENVLHGQTGWVVPKRNPQALAERIQQVISLPPDEKHKIRMAAYNRVKSEFDLSVQAEKFSKFFE